MIAQFTPVFFPVLRVQDICKHSSQTVLIRTQQLFIIQSSNEVDSNWLREVLDMQHMRSYKTGKVSKSNVISIQDFREAITRGQKGAEQ